MKKTKRTKSKSKAAAQARRELTADLMEDYIMLSFELQTEKRRRAGRGLKAMAVAMDMIKDYLSDYPVDEGLRRGLLLASEAARTLARQ